MQVLTPIQFAAHFEKWKQAKRYHSEPAPEELIRVLSSCIKKYGIKEIRKHAPVGVTLYQRAIKESIATKEEAIELHPLGASQQAANIPSFAEVIPEPAPSYQKVETNSSLKSITITNANGVSLKIDGYDNAENLVKLFLSNNGSL